MNYSKHVNVNATVQTQPIFGREAEQVQNSAGGFVFAVTPEQQFMRFLILGTEGGSYYASEKAATLENAKNIQSVLTLLGNRAVDMIVEVSTAEPARAPKNDPAIFALAMAAVNPSTRTEALAALTSVCRIPTHLFTFLEAYQALGGGWGRLTKRIVSNWYLEKDPKSLAYALTKYQNRNGWTNRDVLRLAHPKTGDAVKNSILHWAVNGTTNDLGSEAEAYIAACSLCLSGKLNTSELVKMIVQWKLPFEVVPPQERTKAEVWEALLGHMPMTAMIRNLATMTRVGLLAPMKSSVEVVASKINPTSLAKARMHPLNILSAMKTYQSGCSVRGDSTWTPVPAVVDLLENAFYQSFSTIEPMNKRTLIALDISGSMTWAEIAGLPGLTPRIASAAMSMAFVRTEPQVHVTGFSTSLMDLTFMRKTESLTGVLKAMENLPFGGTDCSLPMIYAAKNKMEVDVFQVYTDSETYAGSIHPSQALAQYRQKMGINAKLVVCGMVSNGFTIADPRDVGMIDVVGADSSLPDIIREFSRW